MLGIEVNDSRDHRFLVAGCSGKIDWLSGRAPMNLASRSDGLGRGTPSASVSAKHLLNRVEHFSCSRYSPLQPPTVDFILSSDFFGRDSSSDFYDHWFASYSFHRPTLATLGKVLAGTVFTGDTVDRNDSVSERENSLYGS